MIKMIKMTKTIIVSGLDSPQRVDIVTCQNLDGISRSKLKTGLKKLLVNSKKKKLSSFVNNGDIIELNWEDPVPKFAEPEKLKLNIIYEDENLIVLNKRSGMVTHPASGNWSGTLVNALNYYRLYNSKIKDDFSSIIKQIVENNSTKDDESNYELKIEDLYRLGIVHRLDKDTSGLIITARNLKTQELLKQTFKKRSLKKYYLAILNGVPAQNTGRIKTSVFRSPKNRKKFDYSLDLKKGKVAISSYKVLKSNSNYSLVAFRIFTGRTHQIRLHAKALNCPVLGDKLYGKKNDKEEFLMLHAYKLILQEPFDKSFKAKLPKHFKTAMKRLDLC